MSRPERRPICLGLAGGSASGKGRVIGALNEALCGLGLRTKIFHMDRYFKQSLPKCVAPFSGREYPDYNQPDSFHMDRLLREVEGALRCSQDDVIIVEGLMVLQNSQLREQLDLKIFIDADPDERIVRRLRRNMAELELSFDEIADYYLDSVRFRHGEFVEPSKWHADIIMNGSQWSDTAIELLVDWIRCSLEERGV